MNQIQIAQNLRAIIVECVSAPGGDPTEEQCQAAAIAFLTIEGMGQMTPEVAGYEECFSDYLNGEIAYGQTKYHNPRKRSKAGRA